MNKPLIFLRHRALDVILIVLAIAITGAAGLYLPGSYRAESDVALLPSISSSKPYGYNPYLSFNSSLAMTAQIVSYQMMDSANVAKLDAAGYSQSFSVSIAATIANGPILTITATGGDKDAVEATLLAVTKEVPAQVAALQHGISKVNQITVLPISADQSPQLSASKTARPLAVILAVGLVLALAIPRMIRRPGVQSSDSRSRLSDEAAPVTHQHRAVPEAYAVGHQYVPPAVPRHDQQWYGESSAAGYRPPNAQNPER